MTADNTCLIPQNRWSEVRRNLIDLIDRYGNGSLGRDRLLMLVEDKLCASEEASDSF